MNLILNKDYKSFLTELKTKIAQGRYQAARAVNRELIFLYHHIGSEILTRQKTLGWGAKIIDQLSTDLRTAFPEMKGFSSTNLKYMRLFAETFTVDEISQQLADQLPWFHIVIIMTKLKLPKERKFYIQNAIKFGWSRNILEIQIDTNLFGRQGKSINNFKNKLPPLQSDLAENTLKDPYIFDFLSIGQAAHEREIEKELISHIEKFLLELGEGFAFMGRQYHLHVDDEDYYLDLLFYHVKLRCYIVVELKAGKFKPEYAGKMNFYLSAVDELLKHPDDAPSIGIILCRSKKGISAEYALRDLHKPIGLAEYRLTEHLPKNIQTALPSIEELEALLKNDK